MCLWVLYERNYTNKYPPHNEVWPQQCRKLDNVTKHSKSRRSVLIFNDRYCSSLRISLLKEEIKRSSISTSTTTILLIIWSTLSIRPAPLSRPYASRFLCLILIFPASEFPTVMESIQSVRIVRHTGPLKYNQQHLSKRADTTRPITTDLFCKQGVIESLQNTANSMPLSR